MKRSIALAALALAGLASPALGAGALKPYVVREAFTPLPCSPDTTTGREGCAEQQIVKTDKTINSLSRAIFPALPSRSARQDYNAAQRAWVAFRHTDCLSVSDKYQGGTESNVLFAQCEVTRNRDRITELKAFRYTLTHP